MLSGQDLLVHQERYRELLRDSERWHRLRIGSIGSEISSVSGRGRKINERRLDIRWGKSADSGAVSRIMEMNGRPRWEAFEERFIVAEEDGRLLAAMSYGSAEGRMNVGEVVADPWGEERDLSVAIYRAAVRLAAEVGASEVRVGGAVRVEYLVEAGYSHGLRGWTAEVGSGNGKRVRPAFRERVGRALGRTSVPGM